METIKANGKIAMHVDGKEVDLQPASEVEFADSIVFPEDNGNRRWTVLSPKRYGKSSFAKEYMNYLRAAIAKMSRNKREGRYAGKINGRHRRSLYMPKKWTIHFHGADGGVTLSYRLSTLKVKSVGLAEQKII